MKFSKEETVVILTQNIVDNFTIKKELIYKNRIQYLNRTYQLSIVIFQTKPMNNSI